MAASLALQQTHRPPPRLMRAAGAAVIALLAVAILLWIVPAVLDWSRYRGAIARFASAEIGRPVRIDGAISLVLLPAPVVTASGVSLDDSGDGLTLVAPALSLRLAFAPLLAGRIVPRALTLRNPAIRLPWPLPPAALAGDRPDWLPASSARIEHGTMSIGTLRLADVNAGLAAAPAPTTGEAAPADLTITGTAHALGLMWHFTDRLGAPDLAGDAPIELTLNVAPRAGSPSPDAAIHVIGTLTHDGTLSARLTAHAADLSRLMPAPAIPAQADGTIAVGKGPAQAALALDVGGVGMTAALHPSAADQPPVLSLETGRLDLDAWDRALTRLRSGHAHPRALSSMLVLPFPISLDLHADAVQLRGGLIRNVHAAMDIDGAAGTLRAAAATLPGQADVTLAGKLRADASGLRLDGRATLDAPRLRDTLNWLRHCGLRLGDALPPDVLREARLAGNIAATRDGVEATGLHGSIEHSQVSGRIAVTAATGAIEAQLAVDTLPGDNWLPAGALPGWSRISGRLASSDVALKLDVGTLIARGRGYSNVRLDAATDAGGLAINALSGDIDGMHLAMSGTIGGDGALTDGSFALTAPQATGLGRDLAELVPPGWRPPDYLWSGPVGLHVDAAGPRDALVANLALDLADARLEAHPALNLVTGAWSTELTLRHPGAPRLLDALGLPHARDWLGEGSLSLLAQLSGGRATPTRVDSFDLTAGGLHATGALAFAAGTLTGRISAESLPLPFVDAHATAPIPLDWLRGWSAKLDLDAAEVTQSDAPLLTSATSTLSLRDGVATLALAHATLASGAMAGKLTLDATAAPPRLALQTTIGGAALTQGLFGTDPDIATGATSASLTLSGEGYSPAAVTASLAGALHLDVTAGTLSGVDLPAAHAAIAAAAARAVLTAALQSGTTAFDHLALQADIANGLATITRFDLTGSAGPATATGSIDLPAGTMNLLAALPDQLGLRLTGPVAAARRLAEPVEPAPIAVPSAASKPRLRATPHR